MKLNSINWGEFFEARMYSSSIYAGFAPILLITLNLWTRGII
jgi:hypothetical protein